MATIGKQLTAPETGWRRYDDTDSRIIYSGSWFLDTTSGEYNTTTHLTTYNVPQAIGSSCTIKFYGTKIRLIGLNWSTCSNNIDIYIDGVLNTNISQNNGSGNVRQILNFESTVLIIGTHVLTIINKTQNYLGIDAIDIDNTGYLVHPTLNQVSDINSMQIGDCIPCRYTATTSGSAGYFSELGLNNVGEIPITGTTTPDGLFYFIKTAKGTLVADRVIQTSISWGALNTAKFINGKSIDITDIIPQPMTSYTLSPLSITQSGCYGADYGWHAFDKNAINDNDASDSWYVYNISPSYISKTGINKSSHYLKIDLGSAKTINRIDLSACVISGTNHGIKDFEIYTSLDDTTYTLVYSGTHPDNYLWHSYSLTSSNARYVMILVLNSYYNGGTNLTVGIQKVTLGNNSVPNITKIRSLTGGVAYIDANGNSSLTDNSLGAWSTNNEWDTYIVNSTLNGKITAGDDNIWHWKTPIWGSWCKNTWNISIYANTNRMLRGSTTTGVPTLNGLNYGLSTLVNSNLGFRPVLNYIESDIVSEVIY